MATLTLKINDEILDKVLWLLKQFKKSDVEIVDEEFLKIQKEVVNCSAASGCNW